MIIKVKMNAHGARLARYLTTEKEGERATVHQLRGFGTDDLMVAFRSIQLLASVTQCKKPFDHVMVRNDEADRRLTIEEWEHIADRVEEKRGLSGQPRAMFFHEKDGAVHMHLVFSRIDEERMVSIKEGWSHYRSKELARELERDMELTIVRNHRTPEQGPSPKAWEEEQARRLKLDPEAVREIVQEVAARVDSGRALDYGLAERNLTLARGDKRTVVVIDERTGVHSLPRLLGIKTKALEARFPDIDPDKLPSVAQAREAVRERTAERERQNVPEPTREERRARAQILAAQDAYDERHFYTFSRGEKARTQAKADAARERREEGAHKEAAPSQEAAYDREAEAVRQTTTLIDGAAKAAPEIARREDAREAREHDRVDAKRELLQPGGATAPRGRFYDAARAQRDFFGTRDAGHADVYDREAEAVRQAIALIDGAAKAAPEIAARLDREPETKRVRAERPLSRLEGQVRLAFRTTTGVQTFRDALAKKQMVLARVTEDDVDRRDRDELAAVAASTNSWMVQRGGFLALTPELKEAARAHYAEWTQARGPENAEKRAEEFPIEKHVDDAQAKWKKRVDRLGGLEAIPDLVAWRDEQIAQGFYMPTVPRKAEAGDLAVVTRNAFVALVNERTTGEERDAIQARFAFLDRRLLPTVNEAQSERTAEKRSHFGRITSVRAAIAIESEDVQAVQIKQRVTFGYSQGKVLAVTGRYTVALNYDEGQRVLDHMNASRREAHDHQNAMRIARGDKPELFEPLQEAHLPDERTAQRMAYGLERRAEIARTVTEAFAATALKQDGGLAFLEGLTAGGLALRSDQAKRLHIRADDREIRLNQFVSDRDQERYLPAFVARKPVPGVEVFKSASDRRDERDDKWEKIHAERFAREVKYQTIAAIKEPFRAVDLAAAKAAPVVAKTVTIVTGPARLAGGLARGVADLVGSFGKHAELEEAARRPAPLPVSRAVPVVEGAAAARDHLRRENMTARPDAQTRALATMHSSQVGEELRARLRHLEEQYKLDNERGQDGSRGRERSR